MTAPDGKTRRSRGGLSPKGSTSSRMDRVVSIPLPRLFHPDPDPTKLFPGEGAEIDGYIVAPDRSVTIAALADSSRGFEMLDLVWETLRHRGVGRRRMTLLDDRGRTVSVMTLAPPGSGEFIELLRSRLVVPVRAHDGFAEVHLLATPEEIAAIEGKFPTHAQGPSAGLKGPAERTEPASALDLEDWAFLGLLCSVGAFDGPAGPSPRLLAELFGLEPDTFARRARAVERGLGSLVTDLFGPAESGKAATEGMAA